MTDQEHYEMTQEFKQAVAGLVKSVISAMRDGKYSPVEAILTGQRGVTLAATVYGLVQSLDTPEEREAYGQWWDRAEIKTP